MRNICFLNMHGDITITWEEKDDETMEKLIKEKLKEGCQFFVVEKGFIKPKEKIVKSLFDIKNRTIKIKDKDKDIEDILTKSKSIQIANNNQSDYQVKKISTDVGEIKKNDTVCVKSPVGG